MKVTLRSQAFGPTDQTDFHPFRIDEIVKVPYAVTPAKSVPDSDPGAGVQKFLKRLGSRLRGNDEK